MKNFSFFKNMAVVSALWAVAAGCAVGPDFHAPDAPVPGAYVSGQLPAGTASAPVAGGESQRFLSDRNIPNQWWTLFKSEPLNQLIRQAFAGNPTLTAAMAALRQAEETRRAGEGELFPKLDAGFSAGRQQFTGASFGQPGIPGGIFTLYNASVNVSYALDVFGGTRRMLEALGAQVDYQQYLLEATYLSLTSNIVTTAVQEASLRAQIKATLEILSTQEQQLALVERRFQLGGISRSDILAQQSQLAQTRATLPPLEKQLAQIRHQLAVLAGKPPAEAAVLPEFELKNLSLPIDLPVSLPSSLARQRPDIRASEALLHAACAQVGVATANLFPQLSISGNYGKQSTVLNDLFSGNASVWGIGSGVTAPIFRGGELTAKKRAAVVAYDQAEAQYRVTVLQALQNVADVLQALEDDARTLNAQADAEKAARESLGLAQKQFELGAANYLIMLDAQRQHQQSRITLAQAQAARIADTAALFQALGGGWGNRQQEKD